MWGSRTRWNSKSNGTVSDEALQAQAWLPSCLRALLAEVLSASFFHLLSLKSFEHRRGTCGRLPLHSDCVPRLTVSIQRCHLLGPVAEGRRCMQAEKAADAVLSWETAAEYEGGGTSLEEASSNPKGTGAACIIVEVCRRRVTHACCKPRSQPRERCRDVSACVSTEQQTI